MAKGRWGKDDFLLMQPRAMIWIMAGAFLRKIPALCSF